MAIPRPGTMYPQEYWDEYNSTSALPFVSPEIQAIAEGHWLRDERKPKPCNNVDPNMIPPTAKRQGDHSWDRFDRTNVPGQASILIDVLYPSERGIGHALKIGFRMLSDDFGTEDDDYLID